MACATKYMMSGTDLTARATVSGNVHGEYFRVPEVHSLRAVTMWIYTEDTQDTYSWHYFIDARWSGGGPRQNRCWGSVGGATGGYATYNPFSTRKIFLGNEVHQFVSHDFHSSASHTPNGPRTTGSTTGFATGSWRHLYIAFDNAKTCDINILAHMLWREDLQAKLISYSLWSNTLTAAEVDRCEAAHTSACPYTTRHSLPITRSLGPLPALRPTAA